MKFEKEAFAESKELFGIEKMEEGVAVVCGNCFKKLSKHYNFTKAEND
jgi:hypothetical protein